MNYHYIYVATCTILREIRKLYLPAVGCAATTVMVDPKVNADNLDPGSSFMLKINMMQTERGRREKLTRRMKALAPYDILKRKGDDENHLSE